MLTPSHLARRHDTGSSLVEVLITLLILSFGLLGVAGLQSKMSLAQMESYQRSQALMQLAQITDRINANRSQAASYVGGGTVGTGDTQPADCTTLAVGPNRDLCEWSNSLKGAAESASGTKVGSMVGAVGCITQVQAPNPTLGACLAGIYQVSVAWQGMSPTGTPAAGLACGQGLYGADDRYRRVIAARVVIAPLEADGTTSCF
jgi:type IV pilus assembly protein PilV